MPNPPDQSVDTKVRAAIRQWRDSLVNLTGRNRLLNYRPTRASTIEFTRHSAAEVHRIIASSDLTYTMGTRPPEKVSTIDVEGEDVTSDELEQAVLDQLQEFDFDSYPDHLFADKTQRDVDRALRLLAGTSKREYIDKGLRTLYVAIGELSWKEDSGDARRSPLLLLPVELEALGPRERLYLKFSEDDIAVNPALAIRVADDYGLALPTVETVLSSIEASGVESAIDLFRAVKWPEGWEVRDFSALGVFMFAKEAMYRDLLDHEDSVAEATLVQNLSGAVPPEASPFAFEPHGDADIDEVAPPESTPLVLDADASQRAAVLAAVEGKSFTLDGPPGTGKSQTIANIIGGLIEAGKTVLFVSEKAVALDVVRDRLSETGLDPFLFELHSSKATRKEVALRLGGALASQPTIPKGMTATRMSQLREARALLSEYAIAANEFREPLGSSFHDVLGWLEASNSNQAGPAFTGAVTLTPADLAQIEDLALRLRRHWSTYLKRERATWFALSHRGDTRYLLAQLLSALAELRPIFDDTKRLRNALGLDSVDTLARVVQVVNLWHSEPQFQSVPWVDRADFVSLAGAVDNYQEATGALDRSTVAVQIALGDSWESAMSFPPREIPTTDRPVFDLPGLRESSPAVELEHAQNELTEAAGSLATLRERATLLAMEVGARVPQTVEDVDELLRAARALTSADAPTAAWIYEVGALASARAIALSMREAEVQLDHAERDASVTFTNRALTADLSSIERLAETTRGFFKRFGSEHRALRQALAEISTQKWKLALAALPAARAWSNATVSLRDRASVAETALSPFFNSSQATDWEGLERRFANATSAAGLSFVDRVATERVVSQRSAVADAIESIELTETCLADWRSRSAWAADGKDGTPMFTVLGQRLSDRGSLLPQLIAITTAQSGQLGLTAGVDQHLIAARLRSEFEIAHEAARVSRDRLHVLSGDWSRSEVTSSADAALAKDKLNWARRLLTLSQDAKTDHSPFTEPQVQALLDTQPITGEAVISRYQDLASQLIGWFHEVRHSELFEDLRDYTAAVELVTQLDSHVEDVDDWFSLESAVAEAEAVGIGPAVRHARDSAFDAEVISDFLLATVFRGWLDMQLGSDPRLGADGGLNRDEVVTRFRQLDAELAGSAVSRIIESGVARRPRLALGQSAIIRREAEKKRKHIPVRDLIDQARDVILALHPCFMMSPLAVSQYLPAEKLFDVVIFDEASQVLPGDAINCVYRGSALIAAGDQKQLPPTSFFTAAVDELDDDDEDDVANDYESILDLMKSSGSFTAQSLRWHYRSRHEDLIAYSNSSFYESKLITFPGAVAESADAGVRFFPVSGVYRRSAGRDNPIEAKHVAGRVMHHFTTRPGKSLGVVAFSTAQRDAIESAIELARSDRPDLDGHFGEDRAQGFFVKSLESVQGDERDAIIFSIGYGPDENGKVYRQFGPVSRNGGERRLNVAITRAKELVEVVSSMTASDIGEVNSAGARHLRRYLDFAERGPDALQLELGPAGMDTESPFEDAVVQYVRSLGFEVQPQVGLAGYRIDIGVKHPNQPGAFMLGIECDGAMYHSSRAARDRDRLRHQILEGLGWHLHHIWGTAWYRHPDREKERLAKLLEEYAARPVVGRVTARKAALPARPTVLVEQPFDENPTWVSDYRIAKVEWISPRYDLSESYSAGRLVPFVTDVAKVEAPIHIDLLTQRLRDNSIYDRIGSRIRETLGRAIKQSGMDFDGEFVRMPGGKAPLVRRGTDAVMRTVEQVPIEELRLSVELLVADAIGISRVELVRRIAGVFGWRRTGSDIRARVDEVIDALVEAGRVDETPAGLRPGQSSVRR